MMMVNFTNFTESVKYSDISKVVLSCDTYHYPNELKAFLFYVAALFYVYLWIKNKEDKIYVKII